MAFAATIFMFPSIITRLESYLIALEACEKYGLKVYPDLALESITKDSYSDDQEYNEAEQVQLQRGMGKNYERLEFLGDCYLKMGTTIALYCLSSVDQESDLHIKRIALICNRRLFETAKKTNLYEYVRTRGLSRYVALRLLFRPRKVLLTVFKTWMVSRGPSIAPGKDKGESS